MADAADARRFITPKMLASHYNKCKKKHCVRCFWHRRGPALRKQFVFREKKSGEARPWLVMAQRWRKKDKPVLGIGCWLCCHYQTMLQQKQDGLTSASTFADLSLQADPRRGLSAQCKKHEDCKFHKDALLHCTTGTGALLSGVAPSAKEFQSCLRRMRKGRSARDGGGSSDKTNLMRWCISEAMLDEHRAAARKCSSVVLIRDERHGKLMVRFRLCESATLNVRSGVLALETLPGGHAEEILQGTRRGLEMFCQSRYNAPRGFRGSIPEFDKDLFEKLRQNCQMVVTDCASAELLAQNLATGFRRTSAAENETPLFPGQKIIGRDRAHASQRLLSRPWSADEELRALLQDMMGLGEGCKLST